MMLTAALLAALAVPSSALSSSDLSLNGVDVYRSRSLDRQGLEALLGRKPELYIGLLNEGQDGAARARALFRDMMGLVRGAGDFSYVDMTFSRRVKAAQFEVTMTFDVVDASDADRRMPFAPTPRGKRTDPGGLLAQWRRYVALAEAARAGGDVILERPSCRAFYCLWAPSTPESRGLEDVFVREVPGRVGELLGALSEDPDPADRSAAVFLLSYSTSAADLAEWMTRAVRDADAQVRVSALSVLADLAGHADGVSLDVPRLRPALDYPSTAERAKALSVFAGLAVHDANRSLLASRIGTDLARLNRCLDPDVRDLAYTVLSSLSRRSLPREDYDAWDRWATEAAGSATPE